MLKGNNCDGGKKSESSLLQLPSDVFGLARFRLSNLSSRFKNPSDNSKSIESPKSKQKSKLKQADKAQNNKDIYSKPNKDKYHRQASMDTVSPSKPISIRRQNSICEENYSRSYPETSSNHLEEHNIKRRADSEERKPTIENICLFPRMVLSCQKTADTTTKLSPDLSDKPRKKLSFREPEIVTKKKKNIMQKHDIFHENENESDLTRLYSNINKTEQVIDLESQALRIVRSVGQAFDVCKDFSPEPSGENLSNCNDSTEDHPVSSTPIENEKEKDLVSFNSQNGSAETAKDSAKIMCPQQSPIAKGPMLGSLSAPMSDPMPSPIFFDPSQNIPQFPLIQPPVLSPTTVQYPPPPINQHMWRMPSVPYDPRYQYVPQMVPVMTPVTKEDWLLQQNYTTNQINNRWMSPNNNNNSSANFDSPSHWVKEFHQSLNRDADNNEDPYFPLDEPSSTTQNKTSNYFDTSKDTVKDKHEAESSKNTLEDIEYMMDRWISSNKQTRDNANMDSKEEINEKILFMKMFAKLLENETVINSLADTLEIYQDSLCRLYDTFYVVHMYKNRLCLALEMLYDENCDKRRMVDTMAEFDKLDKYLEFLSLLIPGLFQSSWRRLPPRVSNNKDKLENSFLETLMKHKLKNKMEPKKEPTASNVDPTVVPPLNNIPLHIFEASATAPLPIEKDPLVNGPEYNKGAIPRRKPTPEVVTFNDNSSKDGYETTFIKPLSESASNDGSFNGNRGATMRGYPSPNRSREGRVKSGGFEAHSKVFPANSSPFPERSAARGYGLGNFTMIPTINVAPPSRDNSKEDSFWLRPIRASSEKVKSLSKPDTKNRDQWSRHTTN